MEIQAKRMFQKDSFYQFSRLKFPTGSHLTTQLVKHLAHDRNVGTEYILKFVWMAEYIA